MGSNTKTLKKGKGAFARAGTGRSPWKGNGGARDGAGRPARTPQQRRKIARQATADAAGECVAAGTYIGNRDARASKGKIVGRIARAIGLLKYARKLVVGK